MKASAALMAAAAGASTVDRVDRCRVGITIKGLGESLDNDYMANVDGGWQDGTFQHGDLGLLLALTWKDEKTGEKGGCYNRGCNETMMKMTNNKWAIFDDIFPIAVCESGCPDIVDSCLDIPGHEKEVCPRWPATWSKPTTWTLLNPASGGNGAAVARAEVAASAQCCKKKKDKCDSCHALLTCPPMGPGLGCLFWTSWQKECCYSQKVGIVPEVCLCNTPKAPVCDDDTGDEEKEDDEAGAAETAEGIVI
jgi:hypothetical protein